MKNLNELLQRYTTIKTPHATIIKTFCTAVEDILQISLKEKNISISKNTIWIQAPSSIKNEIKIHQKEILKYIHTKTGGTHTPTSIF
tara:strand:- start:4556 stop:4816 length:261 start_codon:yes stop_codon:yes gene_type:complete